MNFNEYIRELYISKKCSFLFNEHKWTIYSAIFNSQLKFKVRNFELERFPVKEGRYFLLP